jgi:hypothetical protein
VFCLDLRLGYPIIPMTQPSLNCQR